MSAPAHAPGAPTATAKIAIGPAELHQALIPAGHVYGTPNASLLAPKTVQIWFEFAVPGQAHNASSPLVDVLHVNTSGGKLFASVGWHSGELEVQAVHQDFGKAANTPMKTLSAHDVLQLLGHAATPASVATVTATSPGTGAMGTMHTSNAHTISTPPSPPTAPSTSAEPSSNVGGPPKKKGYEPDQFVDDPMKVLREMLR